MCNFVCEMLVAQIIELVRIKTLRKNTHGTKSHVRELLLRKILISVK